jgi:hypothetical protein
MYKVVENKIECLKCYVWLNLFKQKMEKSA